MGYESRLHIVQKTNKDYNITEEINGKTYRWAELLATVNLCCVGNEACDLWSGEETDCYFYDGNEEVVEDRYCKPLIEHTIAETIDILERAYNHEPYRRYAIALGLLKGFNPNAWGELAVLHYGY